MATNSGSPSSAFAPVVLAGGSGTRFWPRSRRARAKQVLALDGEQTMIQQTVERLMPLTALQDFMVITNNLLADTIAQQLPMLDDSHLLREPCARNTAPACALAAMIIEKRSPDTVIGIFPSDHVVTNPAHFRDVVRAGIAVAAAGENIVVLGVSPTRPETGYGYIEQGEAASFALPNGSSLHSPIREVRRFTEKPSIDRAEQFVKDGNFAWNSGIFLWSARTLVNAIREHRPALGSLLEEIAAAYGTPQFEEVFAELYSRCENVSIDYAVLEPRSAKGVGKSNIYCIPAEFGWNDLGSWTALHEHRLTEMSEDSEANVVDAESQLAIGAKGNYVFAPGLTVALLGVENLVVVQTEDALLITNHAHAQEVGKIVRLLNDRGQSDLT